MIIAPAKFSTKRAVLVLILAWAGLIASRILGPSDLYDKEQPRTVSYTADLLLHHHWFVQYDAFGIPATKPPLFNWVSAPFVAIFGYQEWALKFPSILSSLVVIGCILLFARWMRQYAGADPAITHSDMPGAALGFAAALIWLANSMTNRLIYLARPDMLLTALLCGAWYAATLLLDNTRPRRGAASAFWLCTTGAALAKGPMALLPLLYLLSAGKFIGGSCGATIKRSGWWWGLPLLLACIGGWCLIVSRQEPEFFRTVLLGREMAGRVAKPYQFITTIFNGPLYMISYMLPWSLAVLVMLWRLPIRQWFKHPLAPAILWVLLMTVFYSFVSSKRPDRFEPAFPAMALIAAYCLLHGIKAFRMTFMPIAAVALAIIVGMGVYNLFLNAPAKTGYGTQLLDFAGAVKKVAGGDNILFLDGQQTPLETLLGRHPVYPVTLVTQRDAQWCIRYFDPGSPAVLVSKPIPQVDAWHPGRLALYRLKPGEGVGEFQDSLRVPIGIADDERNPASAPGFYPAEVTRWHQLWRFHTLPAGTQDGSRPAQE